jgi:asparagine synthase (glutamine-hydrolysing)
MCGIVGAIGPRDDGYLVRQMTASLRHRGPDGAGHFSRDRCHVGATRLSIVDLHAGLQPVFNETRDICVVFNGEIYNHRELRGELRRLGHAFRTETDTEVIVHLYEEMGDDCVRRLEGMFAFAVLDGARVLLARDRLGIKPLYMCEVEKTGTFLFASEIKALMCCPAFMPRLDLQAVADGMALGHLIEDQTYFQGVRALRPGHVMVVRCGEAPVAEGSRRYDAIPAAREDHVTLREAEERLEAALDHAVQTHLAADVEVGLTLSGGLDSSVLALFAASHSDRPLATFSIADHETHADLVQARRVAAMMGSRHHSLLLGFDDYVSCIPDLVAAEEQPSSLFGVPFLWLCRAIGERMRVSLHGEGADELFGGYTYYLEPAARIAAIRDRLPQLKRLGVAPSEAAVGIMHRLSPEGGFDDYIERLFGVEMSGPLERQHLVPVDKCAMAASVEMRVPYLDGGVVELAGRLPLRLLVRPDLHVRKYVLRALAIRRFGPDMLDAVLRSKFGAPAAGLVLLDRFDQMCKETLPDSYVKRHAFGECFRSKRELLMFDMFIEMFMTHRGERAAVGSALEFLQQRRSAAPSLVR